MRVLIVIDDLRRAGAQRVIAQEVRALHPHAVDFRVAALSHVAEPSFAHDLARRGVDVSYTPGSRLLDLRRVAWLCQLIQRVEPDLVHTHLTYANILGALASKLAHRPVVASLHNVDSNQSNWPTAKRRLESVVLGRCARRIVVVSAATQLPTCHRFNVPLERLVVVPNAVDQASIELPRGFDRESKRQMLGLNDGQQLLCAVARLEKSKGHRFLLQALALLQTRDTGLDFRVALVGGGAEEASLRRLAMYLGVAERVDFLGIRGDVSEIIAASDLFVLPSLNEGLSQALLEAMALGTPVVATNVGGTPDVLQPGRTGWRVAPAQPVALADAIQQALVRPRTARQYARAAHTLVAQGFNLQTHVSKLQSLYTSVVAA